MEKSNEYMLFHYAGCVKLSSFNFRKRRANMTPNIWDSKTEIRDEEDLRKKNHPRVTSPTAKDEKGEQSGYKACTKIEEWFGFKTKLKWMNIALLTFLHIGAFYSFYTVDILGNITTVVWSEYLLKVPATFINSISRKSTGIVNITLVFLEFDN